MPVFGISYSTRQDAEKAKAKAAKVHKYDSPRAEEKLIRKLSSLTDNRKLFYYALIDRPKIRAAAVSRITDPDALHMLSQLFAGSTGALRDCADNPGIREDDLDWIVRQGLRSDSPDETALKEYIIANKLQSEQLLCNMAMNLKEEPLQHLALSRLQDKKSILDVIEDSPKLRSTATERLRELWPDSAEHDLAAAMLRMADRHVYSTAADIRKQLSGTDEETDRRILSALENDSSLKPETNKSTGRISPASASLFTQMCAVKLLETAVSSDAILDFALRYTILSPEGEKRYGADRDLLNAALSKLTDKQLLSLIRKADAPHTENKRMAVRFLSQESLLSVALKNKYVGGEAAGLLTSAGDLENVVLSSKCAPAKESALKALRKAEGGQQVLARLYEQRIKDDTLEFSASDCLRNITDEELLSAMMDSCSGDEEIGKDIAERLLFITKAEDKIVKCLTSWPLANRTALKNLSREGRITLARSAINAGVRSDAAETLLDTGHVRVLRNRCTYCGGQVETVRILAGTIEAHNLYKCTQCGRTEHETILDPVRLVKDIYIYSETP